MLRSLVGSEMCIRDSIIDNLHFSGIDTFRDSCAEVGRQPNFPRLTETNPGSRRYVCEHTDQELAAMPHREKKGIHLKLKVDRPVLVIPGARGDSIPRDVYPTTQSFLAPDRFVVMIGNFRMITTASPDDFDIWMGKLSCTCSSKNKMVDDDDDDDDSEDRSPLLTRQASVFIPRRGGQLVSEEQSLIFASFQEHRRLKGFAPMEISVVSADPADWISDSASDECAYGRICVTVQIKEEKTLCPGDLGVNLDGNLIEVLVGLATFHLNLLTTNGIFEEDVDLMLLSARMGFESFLQYISGGLKLPYTDIKMPFNIEIKARNFLLQSGRCVVLGSNEQPIHVVLKSSMIGVQLSGIAVELPDSSVTVSNLTKVAYVPEDVTEKLLQTREVFEENHKSETAVHISLPYFKEQVVTLELTPALSLSIPSIVIGAQHAGTDSKLMVLISRVEIDQKPQQHHSADEEDATAVPVCTQLSVSVGQIQLGGPVSATETSF
eukprot:TRINITY_DN20052_c0_g1_i4.p1 TRINITY_DN20052_c0_g1~~TRINITY_DN20052_c0_g1_i4.p1  ORF type:complete len:493 (+),score=124.81 TRINITY_DN20052_c0_g1_i4:121-1599(+)